MGSATHSFNPDQRFIVPQSFSQAGQTLYVVVPWSPDTVTPGYYMLFVFKGSVPSVAKIVKVTF